MSIHSSHHLQKRYIVPVENNYQPIEGNGGKENEKGERKKKKELKMLDNVSSEQQSSIYVSVNQIYSRKALDQKGQIETTNRLFEA